MKQRKIKFQVNDFTAELLPRNRKAQFKFIMKTRPSLIFFMGLLLVLFAAPIIVALLFKDNSVYNFYNLYQNGKLNETGFIMMSFENNLVFTAICSGLFLIFGVCLSAIFNVYKKLVMGDPIFLKENLLRGVKLNIKSFLLISLTFGIFATIIAAILRFFAIDIVFILSVCIVLIILLPYLVGLYFYKSIYTSNFVQGIYNGWMLYKAAGIKGVLLSLGLVAIPLISNVCAETLLITAATNMVINILYFLFFLPVYLLILYCFYYSIFDIRINKDQFSYYYMKGLFNSNSEKRDIKNEDQI